MQDATFWHQQMKAKKLSPLEFLEETIRKIKERNPEINGLVDFDEAAAVKAAQAPQDWSKPFAGLPIPLKILGQDKKGWSNTMGSRWLSHSRASETDYFVRQLQQSGFYPAGQSNTPEFGLQNTTAPLLYGAAKNPWNTTFSPGGSSGGAAALVAAGIFPIAAASDGGGSIRIPASFTGLIGLKPTRGRMPVGPGTWRSWQGAAIAFAMTTSVRDTSRLLEAMQVVQAPAAYQTPLLDFNVPVKKQLKIGFYTTSPVQTVVSEDAIRVTREAATFLEKQGHQVEEISYPVDGDALIRSYYLMNGAEMRGMFEAIGQTMGPVTKENIEPMSWVLNAYGKQIPATDYLKALALWDQSSAVMETLFTDYDVILSPTTAQHAPKIGEDLVQIPKETLLAADDMRLPELDELVYQMFAPSLAYSPYTQLANLTGEPAISLPTGLTDIGLPIGIQLQAGKGQERTLLMLAETFESAGQFHLAN